MVFVMYFICFALENRKSSYGVHCEQTFFMKMQLEIALKIKRKINKFFTFLHSRSPLIPSYLLFPFIRVFIQSRKNDVNTLAVANTYKTSASIFIDNRSQTAYV